MDTVPGAVETPRPGPLPIPLRIIGLDPGGTTGYAVLNVMTFHLDAYGQLKSPETVTDLLKLVCRSGDEIVLERFRLRPARGRAQGGETMAASVVIGAVEVEAPNLGLCGVPIASQEPSAKTAFPDTLLRRLGMYVRLPHARDAIRHALYRAIFGWGLENREDIQRFYRQVVEGVAIGGGAPQGAAGDADGVGL